jgi:hypothetical protein
MLAHPNSLADIARRCKAGGIRALPRGERREFRGLLQKELRKCAFRPVSIRPTEVLREFCDHVIGGFDVSAKPVAVVDSQPYLRRNAKRLAKQSVPVASLILYAAWIEHWVNMMVTVAMLREGHAPGKPLQCLKSQPRFKDKLAILAKSLGVALPKKLRDAVIQVVDLRNGYVHFVWEGKAPRRISKDVGTLQSVVARCETILEDAARFEFERFDAPYVKLVSSTMRVR